MAGTQLSNSFFGVSVYFIDPVCWVRYKLALGLAVPTGHGAEACAEAAWVVLRQYGIRKEDIDRSMNDTTNASVATGRLLAGHDGTMAHVACMLLTSLRTMHRESVSALRKELLLMTSPLREPARQAAKDDQVCVL